MVYQKPRVLIIDDEQVVCDVLHDELSERGYLCAIAFNGDDALAKLLTQDYDVALLDIKLPGMSGIELLRAMRLQHCNTAAIMITVVNDAEIVVEAMKLGAADYIVKPFDLNTVNTSIRTVLQTKKRLLKKSDSEIPYSVETEEEDKQAIEDSFNKMNAIAFGVEARLDLLDGHSRVVTERTIEVARQLDIANVETQRWLAARVEQDIKRDKLIRSYLGKLERSPLAQRIMGMSSIHLYTPKSGEWEN